MTGSIKRPEAFVSTLRGGDDRDYVVVFADGPTWSISELRQRYDEEKVDELAVRKVGVVRQDEMTVYRSYWEETEVTKFQYDLHDGTRTLCSTEPADSADVPYSEWIKSRGEDGEVSSAVTARLEQLGYK
jgi:hypothetical protein